MYCSRGKVYHDDLVLFPLVLTRDNQCGFHVSRNRRLFSFANAQISLEVGELVPLEPACNIRLNPVSVF